MAKAIEVSAIDDHKHILNRLGHSQQPEKTRFGFIVTDMVPELVDLGPEGYDGVLSVNKVVRRNKEFHITTESVYVLSGDQMKRLNEAGRIRVSDSTVIYMLTPNFLSV